MCNFWVAQVYRELFCWGGCFVVVPPPRTEIIGIFDNDVRVLIALFSGTSLRGTKQSLLFQTSSLNYWGCSTKVILIILIPMLYFFPQIPPIDIHGVDKIYFLLPVATFYSFLFCYGHLNSFIEAIVNQVATIVF
jgi:hypothetical protein